MNKLARRVVFSLIAVACVLIPSSATYAKYPNPVLLKYKTSSEVYIWKHAKLHLIPNPIIFLSWYDNFDNIHVVPDGRFKYADKGAPILPKPGTYMVKYETSSDVYEVVGDTKLFRIHSKEQAQKKYGDQWQSKILVIPDAYESYYTVINK